MLKIDLKGKLAFVAGVGDDQGYGWAIAKALAEAGATILIGTWVPMIKIFTQALDSGKFKESSMLSDGTELSFAKIYPFDAMFDNPSDIPADIQMNKRYKDTSGYTVSEVAASIAEEFGKIDIIAHSLASAPEVNKSLLDTSRQGYLTALSSSSYSLISLASHFGPIMNSGGSIVSLTYEASQKSIPGYGGGMSSAKAALESDTRSLSWDLGRRWGIRINTISAGPLRSRAGRAIGFLENMVEYCARMTPIPLSRMAAEEVGHLAAFLASDLGKSINGSVLFADHGVHIMGIGPELLGT
ncbi:enoyl-[acyl-carrier-protein] reductase [Candidatus Clavichlamydia salmonicola]|uniref:enoyl-[acyl-carrier-protein] reductase n=1 Tax=Candidatus Clavichlamydia salmonicola TaxID=469812 RepID=UPI0018916379|nr:enoyl-[acyl-carrier-protein] reductase [Candidatus Clavichlamydia salmonicola]